MKFKARPYSDIDKRIEIDGPLTIWVDNDDVDTKYVEELVPHMVKALNSPAFLEAIKAADERQKKRHEDDK